MSVTPKQNQALPVDQSKQEQPATRQSKADYTIWCRDVCVDINLSDPDEPRYTFFERVERNGQIEYSTSITDFRTYLDLVKVANVACDHFCKHHEWPNHHDLELPENASLSPHQKELVATLDSAISDRCPGLPTVGERCGPLPPFTATEPTTPPARKWPPPTEAAKRRLPPTSWLWIAFSIALTLSVILFLYVLR